MAWLVLGLVLFLGAHAVRIFADDWRTGMRERIGAQAFKGLYSLISLAGFVLIVWGFGQTRLAPVVLWTPPLPMRHIAGLLMLVSFVMLAAAYVPRNHIKARLGHPMVLATKVWALAHLLANGRLAAVVLCASFLAWAILDFRSLRQRDRAAGTTYPAGTALGTALAVIVGAAAWAGFTFWAHRVLIGISPMGV